MVVAHGRRVEGMGSEIANGYGASFGGDEMGLGRGCG